MGLRSWLQVAEKEVKELIGETTVTLIRCMKLERSFVDCYNLSLISQSRQWHPTPVLLPGKSHGWRSLVGCSPWDLEATSRSERLPFHFSLSCIGEGNGNPLQCSFLENPRDGGAWWAAVYGVAQSRTRLKRLSSSSSSKPYQQNADVGRCLAWKERWELEHLSVYSSRNTNLLKNKRGKKIFFLHGQRIWETSYTLSSHAALGIHTTGDSEVPIIKERSKKKLNVLTNHACVLSRFSHVRLFATLWTMDHEATLSMGSSRQEYWSGLPCPPPLLTNTFWYFPERNTYSENHLWKWCPGVWERESGEDSWDFQNC